MEDRFRSCYLVSFWKNHIKSSTSPFGINMTEPMFKMSNIPQDFLGDVAKGAGCRQHLSHLLKKCSWTVLRHAEPHGHNGQSCRVLHPNIRSHTFWLYWEILPGCDLRNKKILFVFAHLYITRDYFWEDLKSIFRSHSLLSQIQKLSAYRKCF